MLFYNVITKYYEFLKTLIVFKVSVLFEKNQCMYEKYV